MLQALLAGYKHTPSVLFLAQAHLASLLWHAPEARMRQRAQPTAQALLVSLPKTPSAATLRAWAHALEARAFAVAGLPGNQVSASRAAMSDLDSAGLAAGPGVWAQLHLIEAQGRRATQGGTGQLWAELAVMQSEMAAVARGLWGRESVLASQWQQRADASNQVARVRLVR